MCKKVGERGSEEMKREGVAPPQTPAYLLCEDAQHQRSNTKTSRPP